MCRSLLAEFLRIVGKAAAPVDHLKAHAAKERWPEKNNKLPCSCLFPTKNDIVL
jgi:hypothetical protein